MSERFDGCQLGTAPPFGNLFGVPAYVDHDLARQEHIVFNAGTQNPRVYNVHLIDAGAQFEHLIQRRPCVVVARDTGFVGHLVVRQV